MCIGEGGGGCLEGWREWCGGEWGPLVRDPTEGGGDGNEVRWCLQKDGRLN